MSRLVVASPLAGAAVLDRNTALVWERAPNNSARTQWQALKVCSDSTLGGQGGWRLPALNELTSLIDATNTNPSLPTGHPFVGVQFAFNQFYWTATTYGLDLNQAWEVEFSGFLDIPTIFSGRVLHESKDFVRLIWCVRGGGPVVLY
jgi:hypothetical protein